MHFRIGVLGLVLLLTMGDGCSNPNVVGVQDYGSVSGRILDSTTNRPIANAIVSVGSLYTATAGADGTFAFNTVPIGTQTVTARAPGFTTASADVDITKGAGASVGYLRLTPVAKPASLPTLPPPATPTPAGAPTDAPAASPAASASTSPSP